MIHDENNGEILGENICLITCILSKVMRARNT